MTKDEFKNLKIGDTFYSVDVDELGNIRQYQIVAMAPCKMKFTYIYCHRNGAEESYDWNYFYDPNSLDSSWMCKTAEEAWEKRSAMCRKVGMDLVREQQ